MKNIKIIFCTVLLTVIAFTTALADIDPKYKDHPKCDDPAPGPFCLCYTVGFDHNGDDNLTGFERLFLVCQMPNDASAVGMRCYVGTCPKIMHELWEGFHDSWW